MKVNSITFDKGYWSTNNKTPYCVTTNFIYFDKMKLTDIVRRIVSRAIESELEQIK